MIRLTFRSEREEHSLSEPTEQEKTFAKRAFRLLQCWKTPPGTREDGSYDGDALVAWLEAVKKRCAETGHLGVALYTVGRVLKHAPPDPGGLWVHRSVAEVLNAKDAEDMRAGFRDELFNSRGVYWVDPTGEQERELADEHRRRAEEVEALGYHRLAGTLRELAGEYERDAERRSSELWHEA